MYVRGSGAGGWSGRPSPIRRRPGIDQPLTWDRRTYWLRCSCGNHTDSGGPHLFTGATTVHNVPGLYAQLAHRTSTVHRATGIPLQRNAIQTPQDLRRSDSAGERRRSPSSGHCPAELGPTAGVVEVDGAAVLGEHAADRLGPILLLVSSMTAQITCVGGRDPLRR